MRVLFIYPQAPTTLQESGFPLGVGYLSSILNGNGHKTSLLVLDSFNELKVSGKIKKFKPNLIAITSTSDQIILSKKFVDFIYKKFKLPIILGGIHATVAPEECVNILGVTGICRGEGEYAMLEFADALGKNKEFTGIRNFWFKKNGKIIKNYLRPLIRNLDSLPFPNRRLMNYQRLLDARKDRDAEFMASRGCPYTCSYCINHTYKKMYANNGKFLRFRSADNVIAEIKEVISRYNVKIITFHDDTFTLNRAWLKRFCESYKKEINKPFFCNSRPDTLDEENIRLLKSAGCIKINIGIESGNDVIRNKILERHINEREIIKSFGLCNKYGIKTLAFNMIGLPYETEENIKETIRLNKKVKPSIIFASIFRPYPGTKLFRLCKKNKWISKRKVKSYFENTSILNLPSISNKKIKYYHDVFRWLIFKPFISYYLIILFAKINIKNKSLYRIIFPFVRKIYFFTYRLKNKSWG